MYDQKLHIGRADKALWLIGGLPLIFVILLAGAFALPAQNSKAQPVPAEPVMEEQELTVMYDSPNVVTNGLMSAADKAESALKSTEQALQSAGQEASTAMVTGGQLVVQGASNTARLTVAAAGSTASFIGGTIRNTAVGTIQTVAGMFRLAFAVPRGILGFAADTTLVSAVTKPAQVAAAPTIDTGYRPPVSVILADQAAKPAAQSVNYGHNARDTTAAWPIHGEITTFFGVPHWPYQPTHTGIDISDGSPSGRTPVKPFRPGKVIEAVRSYSGLGNYITVDHGNGLTSVYAHLAGIIAQPGQAVDKNTILGTQGSTGASTGTHLHFEIRINGQPVDPLRYINGAP